MENCRYSIKYTETINTISYIMRLSKIRELDLTVKVVPSCIAIIAAYVCYCTGFWKGTPLHFIWYITKFCAAIAAVYFALLFYRNKWGVKGNIAVADHTGKEIYYARRHLGTVNVTLNLYDTYFETVSNAEDFKYNFNDVHNLYDTPDIFALGVINERYQKRFIEIPKEALKEEEVAELRQWLLEKCVSVKKGYIQIKY